MERCFIRENSPWEFVYLIFIPLKFTHALPYCDTQEFSSHRYYSWPSIGSTWAQTQAIAQSQIVELPSDRIPKDHLLKINIISQAEQDFISSTYLSKTGPKPDLVDLSIPMRVRAPLRVLGLDHYLSATACYLVTHFTNPRGVACQLYYKLGGTTYE